MYVFGGDMDGSCSIDEAVAFYRLDMDTYVWEQLIYPNQPRGELYYHSAVLHNDQMIVFGGSTFGKIVSNIHIFNFTACEWMSIIKGSTGDNSDVNLWPSPRCHHLGRLRETLQHFTVNQLYELLLSLSTLPTASSCKSIICNHILFLFSLLSHYDLLPSPSVRPSVSLYLTLVMNLLSYRVQHGSIDITK
jgi:hypothetical protein